MLAQTVQTKLEGVDLWAPGTNTADLIRTAIALCDQWENTCALFTQQMWRRVAVNPWKGEAAKVTYLSGFKERLNEVCQGVTETE
jgi:hypothetical protein